MIQTNLVLILIIIGQEEQATTTTITPSSIDEAASTFTTTSTTSEVPDTSTLDIVVVQDDKKLAPNSSNSEKQSETPKKDGEEEESNVTSTEAHHRLSFPLLQPNRIIFVQQTIRDPITGMIYTRQVPIIKPNTFRPDTHQSNPSLRPPSAFDPLGVFSENQKKRQFYQDMLMSQLTKFEREIEPLTEKVENHTERNDIEDLLGRVADLRQSLEVHQIFNISKIMNNWKQGKLPSNNGPSQDDTTAGEKPPSSASQSGEPRGPPLSMRTLILVPHNHQSPSASPPGPLYLSSRHVPMIHMIHHQRLPTGSSSSNNIHYNSMERLHSLHHHQRPQSTMLGEEYSNSNEVLGY